MPPGGISVLVIDDSPYYRKILQEMLLGMEGIKEVRTAADGEEGIRKVLSHSPDAITLDLNMPRMNGFSFLRWLMKNRPLPVLIVSSQGGEKNVFKALDLGALDFVVKPGQDASDRLGQIRNDLREQIKAVAGRDARQGWLRAV